MVIDGYIEEVFVQSMSEVLAKGKFQRENMHQICYVKYPLRLEACPAHSASLRRKYKVRTMGGCGTEVVVRRCASDKGSAQTVGRANSYLLPCWYTL